MRQAGSGLPPAWTWTARGGMQEGAGSKLDWSKTLRGAFFAPAEVKPDKSGEAQPALYRLLLHCATAKTCLNVKRQIFSGFRPPCRSSATRPVRRTAAW